MGRSIDPAILAEQRRKGMKIIPDPKIAAALKAQAKKKGGE